MRLTLEITRRRSAAEGTQSAALGGRVDCNVRPSRVPETRQADPFEDAVKDICDMRSNVVGKGRPACGTSSAGRRP